MHYIRTPVKLPFNYFNLFELLEISTRCNILCKSSGSLKTNDWLLTTDSWIYFQTWKNVNHFLFGFLYFPHFILQSIHVTWYQFCLLILLQLIFYNLKDQFHWIFNSNSFFLYVRHKKKNEEFSSTFIDFNSWPCII